MSAQNVIELGFNVEELSAEKKQVLDLLTDLFQQLEKYDGTKFNPLGNGGIADLKKSLQDGSAAMQEFQEKVANYNKVVTEQHQKQQEVKKSTDELATTNKKGQDSQAQLNKEIEKATFLESEQAKQIAIQKELNKDRQRQITEEARQAAGLNGAYKQLEQQYKSAALEAKNLAATPGTPKEVVDEANAKAKALADELKSIDAAVGQHQRNVGNYTGSLKVLESELTRVREELSKTKNAQSALVLAGPPGPSSNQNRQAVGGTRAPQEGDIQAVANYNSQLQKTGATIADLSKQEELLNTIVQGQQRGFGSLVAEIRGTERALFSLQEAGLQNTEAFKLMQEKLADVKRDLKEFKDTQKLLSAEMPGVAAMTLAVKGLAGAYAIGAGAVQLFSDGDEKMEKELNKLVAIMTVLQGLQEVHELLEKRNTVAKIAGAVATGIAEKAQKLWSATMLSSTAATVAFRTALIAATGGLLLLLPLAISAFSSMAEAAEDARRSQELLNEVNQKAIDGYAEEIVQIDLAAAKLHDENQTKEQKAKIIDDLQHKYPEYLGNIKNEGALTEDLSDAINDKLIPALEAEAKAKAAQELATEKFKKILEIENDTIENGSKNWLGKASVIQSLGNIFHSASLTATGYIDAIKNSEEEVAKLQKEVDGLFKISLDASDAVHKLGGGEPTGIKTTIINITKEIEARARLIELMKQQQIEVIKTALDRDVSPEADRVSELQKSFALEKQITQNRLNTSLQLNTIETEKIKHDLNERLTTEKHTAQEISDLKAQAATDERALELQRRQIVIQADNDIYKAKKQNEENIRKELDREFTAQTAINKSRLEGDAAIQDAINKDQQKELEERLNALKKGIDDRTEIIDEDYANRIRQARETGKTETEIEAIYAEKAKAIQELTANTQKQIYDTVISYGERRLKTIQDLNKVANSGNQVTGDYNDETDKLNKALLDRTISYTRYINRKRELDERYAIEKDEADIRDDEASLARLREFLIKELNLKLFFAEKELDSAKKGGDDKEIADAQAKVKALQDTKTKAAADEVSTESKLQKDKQKLNEDRVKKEVEGEKYLKELKGQIATQSFELAKSLVDSSFENRINQIQQEIDLNDKRAGAEIDAIQRSSLAQQDKEAETIIIQANQKARDTQLAQEQKQEKIKQAKFDRDLAVAQVVWKTAEAELAAIAAYAGTPIAWAIEAAIATLGAINIATILAKPIPTYGDGIGIPGKGQHPGGLALTGERNEPELISIPGQKPFIVDTPTLLDMPAGSSVLPLRAQDIVHDLGWAGLMQGAAMINNRTDGPNPVVAAINSQTLQMKKAYANSQRKIQNIVNVHIDADWNHYVNKKIIGKA